MPRIALLLAVMIAATPPLAGAQVRLPTQPPIRQLTVPSAPAEGAQQIPAAYRPPPGMCRIWLEGVPPAQQPATTDCPTAVRNRPSNGRVIFGDDYADKKRRDKNKERDKDKDRERRPGGHAEAPTTVPSTFDVAGPGTVELAAAVAFAPSGHGPSADDEVADYSMSARHDDVPGAVTFEQPPTGRRDTTPARPRRRVEAPARGARRDSTLSERRRALRDERLRDERLRDERRGGRTDRDDDRRGGWTDRDDDDDRRGGRTDRDDDRWRGRAGYGPFVDTYGRSPYPLPGRANGICLDRDGDGWCDDSRTGGGFCPDRDGDGRCDDYPELASAPYTSSMPSMRAALDVRNGLGSQMALRWLGTAEVIVRTSELRRTGTPYRAMWLDASTNRLLQVWTDRDGDGVVDRIEIYRNGQVSKIIGR